MSGKKSKSNALITDPDSSRQDPEEGSDGINHWLCLSDEMALSILSLLSKKDLVKVSFINRKFRDLSRDVSLWTELVLDCKDIQRDTDGCRMLLDRCKKLSSLEISNKSEFRYSDSLNIMSVVIRAKQSLKSLKVDHYIQDWTPQAMAKLGCLENLTSLTFTFDIRPIENDEDEDGETKIQNERAGLLEKLANLHHLEVLDLQLMGFYDFYPFTCIRKSFAAMEKVFQKLNKLKEVDIFPAHYDESLVVALAENNPDLKVLKAMIFSSLSDDTIDVLVNSCPGLEEFTISASHSENAVTKLSSYWPNLKCLRVGGLPTGIDHSDQKLIAYFEEFKNLEMLFLNGSYVNVTDFGVEMLLGSAEKLKHLNLNAPKVTRNLVERLRIEYPDVNLRINNY